MADEWHVDADGSLRTPSGMKVAELTRDGELAVLDRVEHGVVRLPLLALLRLWLDWSGDRSSVGPE